MLLRGPADRTRIEIGALKEYVDRRIGHSRLSSSEDTGYAHRAFRIRNHDVGRSQSAFHSVKGNDLFSVRGSPDDDLPAFDLVCIEGMKRLTKLEKDEVGDVHDIVDRLQADGHQLLLEPFR